MDPVTMMAIGTTLNIAGSIGANIQQSIAEKANAEFYREQRDYNAAALQRDLDLTNRDYGYKVGQALGVTAASGIDVGSGSALTNVATILADQVTELAFTKRKGDLEMKLIGSKILSAEQKANMLSSVGYNAIQAGTTYLTHATASGKNNLTGAPAGATKGPAISIGSPNSYLTGTSGGSGTGYLGVDTTF